jgi:predicted transglutaminase-like cysteine proteinase
MDIGICKVDGQGHAVLIVHTQGSDLVLDNNFDDLKPWDDPEYEWIEVSLGGCFLPGNWVKVGA